MGSVTCNTNKLIADALKAAANKLCQPDPYKWHDLSEHPLAFKVVICYNKATDDYFFGKWYVDHWEVEVNGDYRRASDNDLTGWTQCPEYYEEQ